MNETMLSLDDARLFVAVAERLSFVAAARERGIPVSTLSRRISELENSLHVRLLQRTSRRVGLTQEGARLLERARPLVDALARTLETVRDRDDEPSGVLRVTAPVVTGSRRVAPALAAFAKKYPGVSIDLRLTNTVLDIVAEGYDLAFRERPTTDGDLVARRLWSYPYTLVCSKRFVTEQLGGKTRLDQAMLQRLPGIVHTAGAGWRFERADGSEIRLHPKEQFTVDEPRVAAAVAAEGVGIACVMEEIIAGDKRLVQLELKGLTPAPREMHLVYPSRRLLASRVRLAIAWMTATQI